MRKTFVLTQIVRMSGKDCQDCPMYNSFGVLECAATGMRLEAYWNRERGEAFRPNWCPLQEILPDTEEEDES